MNTLTNLDVQSAMPLAVGNLFNINMVSFGFELNYLIIIVNFDVTTKTISNTECGYRL